MIRKISRYKRRMKRSTLLLVVRKTPKTVPTIKPKKSDTTAIQTLTHKPPISREKLDPSNKTLIPECAIAHPPFQPVQH